MDLKNYIAAIQDYPIEGVLFRDVTPLLQNGEAFQYACDQIAAYAEELGADLIVGAESRGFLFGMPLAYNLNKAFVPVRKKGKLPAETISESYNLEYGQATLEIHKDAIKPGQKVVIIDDLIATGGTLEAIIKLVERLGGIVVKVCCLIDLPDLGGKEKIKEYDVETVIAFEGK